MFIREKKITCGKYAEVDIIPRTEAAEIATRGKRGKKRKTTRPKQEALNDKNAKRYLIQLGNGNFGRGDIHLTLTYNDKTLPESVEAGEREVTNYLRRVAYRRKKLNLPPLKYILVTEYRLAKGTEKPKRIHHHIIMNGDMASDVAGRLDRDMLEAMWTKKRINWKKYDSDPAYRYELERIGYANADSIQPDSKNGIEALCRYITKEPQGKKRYSSSRNLERPDTERKDGTEKESANRSIWRASNALLDVEEKCNDFRYSKKKVIELATSPDKGLSVFQDIYKGYDIADVDPVYYEETGWHIYLKMWKKPETKKKRKTRRRKESRKGKGG